MTAAIKTQAINEVSFMAATAITANYLVKQSGTTENTVTPTTAITDTIIGIAQDTAASGGRVAVETVPGRLVKVVVDTGATVAVGDVLTCGTTVPGTVKTAASLGNTVQGVGIALTGGAAGETITMLYRPSIVGPVNV